MARDQGRFVVPAAGGRLIKFQYDEERELWRDSVTSMLRSSRGYELVTILKLADDAVLEYRKRDE